MIVLGPQACGSLDESALREWLVADGLGGALRPAIVVHGSLTEGEGAR